MIKEVYNESKGKMGKTLQVLKSDLGSIRVGRANPQILDRITVDYYGTPTPINQIANISTPEPRQLVISLWESKMISAVEKEIMKSDIGITPNNDGRIIRLIFPELTEERRRDLVKVINKYSEEAKVAIRAVRREANDIYKKMKKQSDITEDDLKDAEIQIQTLTDDQIKKVDEIIRDKEREILEI